MTKNDPKLQQQKISQRLKRKIDNLEEVADVLTGDKLPQGKLGLALLARRNQEGKLGAGKKLRDKKYKEFDEWLARQQKLNNIRGDKAPYVILRRNVRVDNKGFVL